MTTKPINDRHHSRELDGTPPMAEYKQGTEAVPPPHLQILSPTPSLSRWSQSSYSISVSGERGSSASDSAAVGGLSSNAPSLTSLGPLHNRDDDSTNEKRIFGVPRDMCIVVGFLVLLVIAVAVLLAVSFSNGDGGPFHGNENSTSGHQQSRKSHTAITSNLTGGTSGTAVVVQVTTQVVRTTVGTLTVNGSYAGTISSTVFETSAPSVLATVQ